MKTILIVDGVLRRRSKDQHLGMGRRIAPLLTTVVVAGDDVAARSNEHGADRDVSMVDCSPRFVEGELHRDRGAHGVLAMHSATVTSLGRYWRDVLSERTRKLSYEHEDSRVIIRNSASCPLQGIPVEILFGEKSFLKIVDIPAESSVSIEIQSTRQPHGNE